MANMNISRREMIKLSLLGLASISTGTINDQIRGKSNSEAPNIIIIVFDAWSAKNVSLYGYARETMPNLAKFADKSTVYHNHYAAGTFTVPGTSSLLTGIYPWSHRAFQLGGRIDPVHASRQIFSVAKPVYKTLGYTQNKFADQLLYQAGSYLDSHLRIGAFNIQNRLFYNYFKNDARMAFAGFEDNIIQAGEGYDASLFLGPLYRFGALYDRHLLLQVYQDEYVRGLPNAAGSEAFLFEDVVDGLIDLLKNREDPSLMYLHLYPPHEPYCPKRTFWGKFKDDGWEPPRKNVHPLAIEENNFGTSLAYRRFYDEFMYSWDDEFGRLFNYFKESGLLENSYIVLTSDHGEMFERGEIGHITPLIYDPLIHIPLMISKPGQTQREDIHTNTSNVDLLPTLAHIAGTSTPNSIDGRILPGFDAGDDPHRSIFTMDAKTNSSFSALTKYSASVTRDRYRLIQYNYPEHKSFEFYDLDDDPEEMNDLFAQKPSVGLDMQTELMDRINDANKVHY